jgi:hypothetical protein
MGGGCVANNIRYTDRYRPFFPSAVQFHVIRWSGAMDLYPEETITVGGGSDNDPIVIIADMDVAVNLKGINSDSGVGLVVDGSRVVIDNLNIQSFAGAGLQISGDDGLVIRSRIISNSEDGVVVTGKGNRIVDTEVASNGFNGIVIGKGYTSTTCSGGAGISDEGRGTELKAVSVHDNGLNVMGKDCTESSVAAPTACAMLELEALKEETEEQDRRDFPGGNGGFGILIDAPEVKFGRWQPTTELEVLFGVEEPLNPGRYAGSIRKNRSFGVYLNSLTMPWLCRDAEATPDVSKLIAAEVSETTFENNAKQIDVTQDKGLFISGPHPPRLKHVAVVGDERTSEYVVTGSFGTDESASDPWSLRGINPQTVRVEVYLSKSNSNEGTYFLAAQDGVDTSTGDFTIRISNPLVIGSARVRNPSFVVTYIDTESGATAPFSQAMGTQSEDDSDGDGLPDIEEDIDGDGIVGPGESDPANPDTDGDGLTDGEEKNHIDRIAALLMQGMVFDQLDSLDPANPDSDGDCLPDGLEVGVTEQDARLMMGEMRRGPKYELSPLCRSILSTNAIVQLENTIPYDDTAPLTLDNIAMIYDLDGSTITDPTNRDTDRDGLIDGEEDWNFSGMRDGANAATPTDVEAKMSKAYDYSKPTGESTLSSCAGNRDGWDETDPNEPDSDGDGLMDGEEGRLSKEGTLGPNDSSPLLCDTDDDGASDGTEQRVGTFVNLCDTDEDGLGDGIEMGIIHPESSRPGCQGLQAAGTNMRKPTALDPINPDSDGDGMQDGVEDINGNGWVDWNESDPSVPDTDGDGVNDGTEATGDFDWDGVPDFDMRMIINSTDCAPPSEIGDLDCDEIPNSRDEDSDNDGCPDSIEGGWVDVDGNGIPDMYDEGARGCSGSSGGGGGVSMPAVSTDGGEESPSESRVPGWATDIGGGGACSLMPDSSQRGSTTIILTFFAILGTVLLFRKRSQG